MAKGDLNPLEALTEELAKDYVEDVKRLTNFFAPYRPWWTASLTPTQQLWRWMAKNNDGESIRQKVVSWLMTAGVYMGWKTADEVLANIEKIFTSPAAPDLIPPDVVIEIPTELLEMVQASGPKDAATHIRKMEKMVDGQREAAAILASPDQPQVPEPPAAPPPQPVNIDGSPGYPLYGGAPQQPGSKFGVPSEPSLAGF